MPQAPLLVENPEVLTDIALAKAERKAELIRAAEKRELRDQGYDNLRKETPDSQAKEIRLRRVATRGGELHSKRVKYV